MIASIRITNVEKIPLALCCIGGLALVLNFIECPLNCELCPWESNISRRSARILELNYDLVDNYIKRYNPDILFFHGAEPYEKELVLEILRRAYEHKYSLLYGIKANAEYLKQTSALNKLYNIAKYINVLLIEILDWKDIINQLKNIENLIYNESFLKDIHIELVLIMSSRETISKLLENDITKILKELSILPINIITTYDYSIYELDKIAKNLRKISPLTQFPMVNLIEFSSTFCPYCNMPIIVRSSGVLMKISLNSDGSCKYCNKKVVKNPSILKVKKLYKIPIDIPIE